MSNHQASSIICSHPTGNANVRAAVLGMQRAGLLKRFYTSIASFRGGLLYKLSGLSFLSEIARRQYDVVLKPYTRTTPWMEMARILALKAGLHSLVNHSKGIFSVDAVYQNLDSKVSNQMKADIKAVYAYEDGAVRSFTRAKASNIKCLYDLPIGYWRASHSLLKDELNANPEWAETLTGFMDPEWKLSRKDRELQLADQIFVASTFTKSTLEFYPGKLCPVTVIPYGFPPVQSEKKYVSLDKRPLRILFVGGLSQRKGIANLFEAVSSMGNKIELTIVGRKTVENCAALNKALEEHKWIPSLPNEQILELMRSHDVLAFPSLFEGFGLVITEAMSQGTPVITTERTAGPDFIEHGKNGWIVKAGSVSELRSAIQNILDNPAILELNGKAAMETARKRPWEAYGSELAQAIKSRLD